MTNYEYSASGMVLIMTDNKIESLPLEWVRVFEAAGRLGNFTTAANETGLTQAAVSQRIRNLEKRIGAQLFTRQARGVTLTVDGEAWLPYVTNALRALNRSAEDLFGKPLKNIIISAGSAVIQLWIIPRLATLNGKAKYQISLNTVGLEASFSKLNAMIEIRYGNGDWPGVRKKRLYKESLTPLVTPRLLESGKAWQDLPHIAISGPRPGWQEWSLHSGEAPPPLPTLRFDSFGAAHAAAIAGAGVILGSLPLCEKELATNSLTKLSDKTLNLDAGYWMTSKEEMLPQKQWNDLATCLSQTLKY
jgi:LysR family transcriptional regulator, glycine cleavage system transcriptional activator